MLRKNDQKQSQQNCRKNNKKKNLIRPGQTKASLRRQQLALAKKIEHASLVPDEALCCVFEYLDLSDLLRCCCVNKSWKEVAEIKFLWQRAFRRLPKSCQDLSDKVKTTGFEDWKNECINCLKERKRLKVKNILAANNLHSGKKKKAEATRALGVRWMIDVEVHGSSRLQQFYAEEDFVFSFYNLTARWNDLTGIAPLSKWKSISLYAVTPLVFDGQWRPVKNSVCTRSLLFTQSFRGQPLKEFRLVHGDNEVTLYSLSPLFVGIWSSSLPKEGDIAFFGFTTPIHELLMKTQNGNSQKMWTSTHHQIVADDVDLNYGCHGFDLYLSMRNSRKSFYEGNYEFYKNGDWEGDWLVFEHRSLDNPLYGTFFFDIKDKLQFSWKSTVLNGRMEDVIILDVHLIDCNKEYFWNISQPLRLVTVEDNEDFSNYNVYEINGEEESKRISIRVLQERDSLKWTVSSLNLYLHKTSINQWFGTNY